MKIKFLVFTILLAGCSKNEKLPEYVIPNDEFVSIIVDIHLLDGMMNEVNIRREITRHDTINLYSEIFKNHGYTRAQFDSSIIYYTNDINKYDKIYNEVLNKLNRMETELKGEEEENKETKK